jgi:NADPH-dependent glutamate synthase beta subunit-like oxidoreductase
LLLLDLLRKGAGPSITPLPPDAAVVVYDGGKLALDAARRCRELGARNVTILFRDSREKCPLSAADIAAGGLDGVTVRYGTAVQKLIGAGGELNSVEILDIESGKTDRLSAQRLILPAGRFPELILVPSTEAPSTDAGAAAGPLAWEGVLPYKHPWYRDQAGIYAAGDVLSDYSAAIKAIAAGRRAAASIHLAMSGVPLQLAENVIGPQSSIQNVSCVENIKAFPRQIMPICSAPELKRCGEIELGFSEDSARKEAGRCLQCGLICYRTAPPKKPAQTASIPA